MVQDVDQAFRAVAGTDGHLDCTDHRDSEPTEHELTAIGQHQRHMGAPLNPELGQHGPDDGSFCVCLGVRQCPALIEQEHM